MRWAASAQRLEFYSHQHIVQRQIELRQLQSRLPQATQRGLRCKEDALVRFGLRLGLLDPTLVLQRGYAWLTTADGQTIASVRQTSAGQSVMATLADGEVAMTVSAPN
jgi:exodeoxyribonuclease VII large subunit